MEVEDFVDVLREESNSEAGAWLRGKIQSKNDDFLTVLYVDDVNEKT